VKDRKRRACHGQGIRVNRVRYSGPMRCPSCDEEMPAGARVCPTCSGSDTWSSSERSPRPASGSGGRAPADRFAAGTLLAGRYRIVRLLGRGAMGMVYHAEDLTLEVPVALKFLTFSREGDPDRRELFLNEVRLARRITHPNVCRVYDVGEVGGRHFISMEYIDGEDLASLVKRVGRLSTDRALRIGLEIARGLEAAHAEGILHRDLKPANLMIDGDGHAHVADFGLASRPGSESGSGVIAGTPDYMAPEQIGGAVSVYSDLYALGLVLYELFTGRKAYERPAVFRRGRPEPPPPLGIDGLDLGVERAILACLESDPHDRPGSAAEVAAALARGGAPPWHPAPGVAIAHRPNWVLDQRLGEGGFGEAWLAAHRKTGEQRVFKFCRDAAKLRTLQREITLFRLLKEELGRRDDIVSLLDWSLDEPPYFIEAEYTAGGNLREWAARHGGLAAVPLATRLEVVAQAATALAAAHSVGVMHKDVKPANVLVDEDAAGRPHALLADFGIGALTERKRLEAAGITVAGLTETDSETSSGAGTRLYMAPEIVEGKPATLPADVYALGVLLYQMVVADFSRALAPGWQRDVDDPLLAEDVAAAVDGSPERRPACAQLAERLRSLPERRARREDEERRRAEAELARAALERSRRRRKWIAAFLVVLLLFAAALVVAFGQGERAAEAALVAQTLESHQGMARIAAAAVDRNLAAVVRRVEREAGDAALVDLVRRLAAGVDVRTAIQEHTDQLYDDYDDRHFFSWVVADRDAVAQARSPFDAGVVGTRYDYREWFTGQEEGEAEEGPVRPRSATGLTLAFQSTAEGHPVLMSVAAPIRADGEVLGVLAATIHLGTFNGWLAMAEGRSPDAACPERLVLLLHRGQLLRHPCPQPDVPQPPVDREGFFATAAVRDLLADGLSRSFHDPLRRGLPASRPGDLAVAVSLAEHPDWTVVVVQDRGAALRPLARLTGRLRFLGRIALAVAGVVLLVLGGLLRSRRGEP